MSVVVITGASAGVGRATAIQFARHGWCMGLIARGEPGLDAAKADAESLGAQALATVYTLLQCLLGLQPFAPFKMLFVDPHLPTWLPEITLQGS